MTEPSWSAVLDVIGRCEDRTTESGLLNFGSPTSRGGVFVEAGRVCWAAASGLGRRLSDLLAEHASLRGVDLDALHARCTAIGKPLGRALMEEQLIAPDELEAALRQHSAESLVEICRHADTPTWVPRLGPGYAPRLTFRPIELLCDAVALFRRDARVHARQRLDALASDGTQAVAFVIDLASATPLPIAEVGGVTLRDALALGRWSTALRRASHELGTDAPFALATNGGGGAVAVSFAPEHGLLFAVRCADHTAIATTTARHLACMAAAG